MHFSFLYGFCAVHRVLFVLHRIHCTDDQSNSVEIMTPAEKILKMIEEVDPADSDALDEIDKRIWYFIQNKDPIDGIRWDGQRPPRFTRSRDALKAIRPEGWRINIAEFNENTTFEKPHGFEARLLKDTFVYVISKLLPTEELAELHAIIQTIEWERENA